MKQIKVTITNWAKENNTLAWVLVGMIGLPLAMAFGVFIAWLIALILMAFGLPWNLALVTELLMAIGASIGYVLSRKEEKTHGDYY